MTFTALSQNRVELRWLKAVTYDSAGRFVRLARLQNPSFAILGVPTGFDIDVVFAADDAAAVAPTGVADDVRMAPVEAETAAPDKAAAPETPSRRIVGSMLSAGPTSASHAVPLAKRRRGCTSRRRKGCTSRSGKGCSSRPACWRQRRRTFVASAWTLAASWRKFLDSNTVWPGRARWAKERGGRSIKDFAQCPTAGGGDQNLE